MIFSTSVQLAAFGNRKLVRQPNTTAGNCKQLESDSTFHPLVFGFGLVRVQLVTKFSTLLPLPAALLTTLFDRFMCELCVCCWCCGQVVFHVIVTINDASSTRNIGILSNTKQESSIHPSTTLLYFTSTQLPLFHAASLSSFISRFDSILTVLHFFSSHLLTCLNLSSPLSYLILWLHLTFALVCIFIILFCSSELHLFLTPIFVSKFYSPSPPSPFFTQCQLKNDRNLKIEEEARVDKRILGLISFFLDFQPHKTSRKEEAHKSR